MNAGLSNLATLKAHLLPGALAGVSSQVVSDAVIAAIGLGVAGMVDNFCNRKFAYLANDTTEFTGQRDHWYVPRYPLISISQVLMRYFTSDAWTNITGQPITVSLPTGLVSFGYTLGTDPLRVQITYTGGYWFETLEPTDAGYPSTPPTGSTPLPPEVQLAWLLQCGEVWNKRDKLGLGISTQPDEWVALGKLTLNPFSKQMLQPHIRYQLL